ncbi:unnamed protein product [Closterium sp. NIES-53]
MCCAVLCYAVLCCAVLCCAVLCGAVLCCAVLSRLFHNQLSGSIPSQITELTYINWIDMSNNRLSGSLPQGMTGLTQLTVREKSNSPCDDLMTWQMRHVANNLRNNQLGGCLLQPIPPSIRQYKLDNNFFSCGFSTQPDCTQTFIAVQANCLGAADVPPCLMDPQRVKEVCASFCGLSASTPSCAGHGTCFFSGPNRIPTCACLTGYANGELPGTCMAAAAAGVTPADFSFLTSISISSGDGGGAEMAVSGAAAVQADSSVVLTSNQQAAWGAAFLVLRVRLFSYNVKNHSCGREIALKLSFSFSIAPATGSNGVGKGGLAFVLTATDSVPGGDGSTVGYAGMDERSLVVEFDTFQDASSGDPSNSHVGFNIGGSVISIATAAVPELNTGSTKYAWIEYSPVKGGLLSVYVASAATRPAKPVLTRRVSLCDVLKPTFEEATFVLGFTAASSDPPKEHTVLQWSLDTCTYWLLVGNHSDPLQNQQGCWTLQQVGVGHGMLQLLSVRSASCEYLPYVCSRACHFLLVASEGHGFESPCAHMLAGSLCRVLWHPCEGRCHNTCTGDARLIIGKGYRLVGLCALPLGFTLAEATFTTSGVNRFFRYASAGALQPPAAGAAAAGASAEEEQQWAVATNMTWIRPDLLPSWPVPNQAGCGDCWAYVVVASIEAVYAILSANGSLPVFSVSSLVAEMKADCSGGSPSKAFQYLLAVGKRGGGLQVDRVGGATGAAKGVAKARGRGVKGVGVTERSGALGLQGKQGKPAALTAVAAAAGQSQSPLCSPLLKPIAALLGVKCTAKEKTLHKYQDPACFTYNLNHVVLLVGYRLVGSDEAFPHMAPPFWIIRNSWGADWGDGGHMRMDIQGGDGVCGINTLPGVYPIISGMLLLLLLLLSLFHVSELRSGGLSTRQRVDGRDRCADLADKGGAAPSHPPARPERKACDAGAGLVSRPHHPGHASSLSHAHHHPRSEEEGRGKRRTQAPNRLTYEALGKPPKSALAGAALIVGDDEESDYDECAFVFFSPVEMPGEPANLKEALESSDAEEWKKAMESELKSIEENGTWELVELPEGRKAITSKWLFKIKSDANGNIERYKSRLVAKGYQQKEKVDYKELFALVVKPTTLRTLLAGATIKGWVVKQMDVTTAFLNGVLEEEIFMAQPEGFNDGSGRVLKLKKALYGLKQAPRQWYMKPRGVLEEIGFTPSTADHSLFMLGEGEQRSFMVVYVDDILNFSPSSNLVKEVMLKLQEKFKCKALGDVSFYLGLHIERDVEKRCMRVHQRKYLEALAANFGQSEGHVDTPFPSGFKCVKGPEEESVGEEERRRFHSLVGSLMYAAVNTRLDVAFATGQLARVVQCPNEEQVAAGMRVAKYLGQTPTVGLQYSAAAQRRQKGADGVEPGRLFLTAFSDASFASEPEDMTSVGGFICCVGGGPTAWESKKQVDQALSSVESEYMALFRAVQEIVWPIVG